MYIQINNKGSLVAWGAYEFEGFTKEIPDVDYNDYCQYPNKYIYENRTIKLNPNYEEEEKQKEKERIARLNMTKLDFSNYLAMYGVTYEQLKTVLSLNDEALRQWELCERVYRFNPLLDELAKGFDITPEQLDTMFVEANSKKGE